MLDSSRSIPGICEVHRHLADDNADKSPSLLIELPHGATRHAHYQAVQERLQGALPAQLEAFFFVNTDVGTPECAQKIGSMLATRGYSTVVLRSLLPRTLIDCNRTISDGSKGAAKTMTAAIPDYVENAGDRQLLVDMHRQYHQLAGSAYRELFAGDGQHLALQLHSYAPKSVRIDSIDGDIVAALKQAYEPAQYAKWQDRPMVELISQTQDGEYLAPRAAVKRIRANFAAIGIDVAENASYQLHRETWGYRYAAQHPARVLCVELNRGLLATPFEPFSQMTIGDAQSQRLAAPIAEACASFLDTR